MTHQWKRPPVSPTGASHGWLASFDDTYRPEPIPASDLPGYDDTRGRALYRVRWWRTLWSYGKQSANSRYYVTQSGALRFADKLRTTEPNDYGYLHVEVHWAPREVWRPLGGDEL